MLRFKYVFKFLFINRIITVRATFERLFLYQTEAGGCIFGKKNLRECMPSATPRGSKTSLVNRGTCSPVELWVCLRTKLTHETRFEYASHGLDNRYYSY